MPRVKVRPAAAIEEEWPLSIPTLSEAHFSQSVERGIAILERFTPERPVLGVADIADALGMNRSTTHRYLLTLVKLGFVVQGKERKYSLSLRVTTLGMAVMGAISIREHARPYVQELSRRAGFTLAVAVLDGPEVLLVECLRGTRRGQLAVDAAFAVGVRAPAHCTATGKLLLARLPDPVLQERLRELSLSKRAPNTITTKSALRVELSDIRREGLAVAAEEFAEGVCEIAAPIRGESREVVAALSMVASARAIPLEDLVDALGPHLITTADQISARLGYRRPDERVASGGFTEVAGD